MNERLRQAYLKSMGIELVYPRMRLAGARPGPAYDFSTPEFLGSAEPIAPESSAAQATAQGAAEQSKPNERMRAAREQLGLAKESSRARAENVPEKRAVAEPADTSALADTSGAGTDEQPPLNFRLQYRVVGSGLAVLMDAPLYAGQQSQRDCQQLLENILLALAAPLANAGGQVEEFNWPLLEDLPAEETTAHHASQALLGFIAMRRQRDNFTNLLIFTSRTGQIVELLPKRHSEGRQDAEPMSESDYQLERLNCWITQVSSLQEMLSVPAIKREVWQQLQALRSRLATA